MLATGSVLKGMILLCVAYAVTLTVLSQFQHDGFQSQRNDLTVMEDAIRQAAAGDLAMGDRLSFHHNLIFFLIAPFYWLFPHAGLLFALISLGCALGGLGLYLIARRLWGDTLLATVPALIFWTSPAVHYANLYDFHVICIAAALLVWTLWAIIAGRKALGALLFLLFLLCQEDMALVGFFVGLGVAWKVDRRAGIGLALASVAYILVVTEWVVPHLISTQVTQAAGEVGDKAATDHLILLGRYGWLGRSPLEVIINIVTDPIRVAEVIFEPLRWRPIAYFAVSGAIVCWRAWPLLLGAIPHLAMGLLAAGFWSSTVFGTYYWIIVQALVAVAFIYAMREYDHRPRLKALAIGYVAVVGLALSWCFSPLPYGATATLEDFRPAPEARHAALRQMFDLVPDESELAITMNLFPHRPQEQHVIRFPDQNDDHHVLAPLHDVSRTNACHHRKSVPEHIYRMTLPAYAARLREELARRPVLAFEEDFLLLGPTLEASPPMATEDEVKGRIEERLVALEHDYQRATTRFHSEYPKFLCLF